MNVLSCFDGMSCGQIALNRAGIKYDKYFASEIDKHAIKVTQANYPNTVQLGDVTKVFAKDLPQIDLIIGGSPCQGFSFAGKGLNFDDPRSKLFFEFVRLVKECNPKYFLLENVRMKKEHELVISRYLGVSPIVINSSLVSAQNRVRLYWTNINEKEYGLFGDKFSDIPQPKDKGILLKDILESEVDEKYFLKGGMLAYILREKDKPVNRLRLTSENQDKCGTLLSNEFKQGTDSNFIVVMRGRGENNEQQLEENHTGKTNSLTSVTKDNLIQVGSLYENNGDAGRIYSTEGKGRTLKGEGGGGGAKMGLILDRTVKQLNESTESGGSQPYQQNRVYDIDGISPTFDTRSDQKNILIPEATTKGFIEISEGECFDFENPKSETRRGRKMDEKSNCLMAKETDFMKYEKGRIRRLTPVECERLQTVPDIENNVIFALCYESAKNYANVVSQNPKLLKLVLDAEQSELNELVKNVWLNMNANRQSIKLTALQNAGMQIQTEINQCTNHNLQESNIIVNNVVNTAISSGQNQEVDIVPQNVFISITEGKITHCGQVELLPNDNHSTIQRNGEKPLKMFGNEIMQLVEDVEKNLSIKKDNNFIYITSNPLSIKNLEQVLIIYYLFAKNVITGFTQNTTQIKNLSLNFSLKDGYTNHVSDSQRYRMLGNGWTVDVITHIFNFMEDYGRNKD